MAVKHTIRRKDGGSGVASLTARTAIRAFCRECVGFVAEDVKGCTDRLCPLWPFRTYGTPKGCA